MIKAVEENGAKNWKKIAECVKGRTDVQCLHRWQKVLNPELVKGPWTEQVRSNCLSFQLISLGGSNRPRACCKIWCKKMVTNCLPLTGSNWQAMQRKVTIRKHSSTDTCRWTNHLDTSIKKGNWEAWEDQLIVKLQKAYGNKWAKIAKHMPGRYFFEI